MKEFLKLERIIFAVLICISINILQGCTSIEDIAYNKQNQNEIKAGNKENINLKAQNENMILNYNEVKNELIRFHVIANSDSEEDQNLKLKVKNKVIDYLYPYLNASQSLEQSRKIIKDNMEEVKKLAEQVIKDNNYKYGVKTELSRENFPEKSYGKITLPQGNYEAFRIIIGSGQGKNWWCVMFPPLCFVDETKAEVEYDKTEERIKSQKGNLDLRINLNDEDKSEEINNQNSNKKEADKHDSNENLKEQTNDKGEVDKKNTEEENKEDIQVEFKLLEIIKNLFN